MSRIAILSLLLAVSCTATAGEQASLIGAAAAAGKSLIEKATQATEAIDVDALLAYTYSAGYNPVKGFGCLRKTIAIYRAENAQECRQFCNKDARCGAITFSTESGKCYIKPSCVPKERKAKVTNDSYIKKQFESLSEAAYAALTDAMEKIAAEEEEAKRLAKEQRAKERAEREARRVPDYLNEQGMYNYTGEYDIFEGEGCVRSTIGTYNVKDMAECQKICNEDIRCAAATLNTNITRCYTKPACSESMRVPKVDNISAVKQKFKRPSEEDVADWAKKMNITLEEDEEEEEEVREPGQYKFDQGKRCVGTMISQKVVQKTVDCRSACDENPKCTVYAFRRTNKMCRLFETCNKSVNAPEWFTATRTN